MRTAVLLSATCIICCAGCPTVLSRKIPHPPVPGVVDTGLNRKLAEHHLGTCRLLLKNVSIAGRPPLMASGVAGLEASLVETKGVLDIYAPLVVTEPGPTPTGGLTEATALRRCPSAFWAARTGFTCKKNTTQELHTLLPIPHLHGV